MAYPYDDSPLLQELLGAEAAQGNRYAARAASALYGPNRSRTAPTESRLPMGVDFSEDVSLPLPPGESFAPQLPLPPGERFAPPPTVAPAATSASPAASVPARKPSFRSVPPGLGNRYSQEEWTRRRAESPISAGLEEAFARTINSPVSIWQYMGGGSPSPAFDPRGRIDPAPPTPAEQVMGNRAAADRDLNRIGRQAQGSPAAPSAPGQVTRTPQMHQMHQVQAAGATGAIPQGPISPEDAIASMRAGRQRLLQGAAAREIAARRAKLGASVGSYQNPELMRMSNEQQIADKLAAQRGGAAPGQKVDPRWQLGGLSVSGQRPAGAGAAAGGDPLERVHQLVQENRPMGPDALRQRQLHLMGMIPPSQDKGASRKTHGKYGGGPVHRGESVATLPGQGYRDQKTRIALHGPSSEYAMNRDGLDESEKALIRDAAFKQKQEATSNASRIAQKVKLNRQMSALNNARQMAGSVDPRRQYQSQMILERQIREGANANGGNDPLQAFIRTTNQLGLPQHLAAPLIAQHQKYLNEMELERQKAFANIEAGKAGGQIPKDYQNPFGKPVGAAGLPQDAGSPPAAAPAPAGQQVAGEPKKFKSFKDRVKQTSDEKKRKKEQEEYDAENTDLSGISSGVAVGF